MYCTRKVIRGENFRDWLKKHGTMKAFPSKVFPYTVYKYRPLHGKPPTFIGSNCS